jgi:hypothetical protein
VGIKTHYLIHFYIFGGIFHLLRYLGGKDKLFEAFSTYLEACFTFEEG